MICTVLAAKGHRVIRVYPVYRLSLMRTQVRAAGLPQLSFEVVLMKEQALPNFSERPASPLSMARAPTGTKTPSAKQSKLRQLPLFPEAVLTRDERLFRRRLRKYLPKGSDLFIKVIKCVERRGACFMAYGLSWDGVVLQLELRDAISPEDRPELIWHAEAEEVPFGYDTLSKKWNRHSTSSALAVVREDLCDFRRKDACLK